MAHPNEELLRKAYAAFAQGDVDSVLAMFADNIRWNVQGESPLSGVYIGRDEVRGLFEKVAERSGGTFHLEVHDVLANDEHGVVLVMERAEREGKELAHTEAHVWHVSKGGMLTEFWALPSDLAAADAFWA